MKTTIGDTVIRVGSDDIQVKNIPVFICPACGKQLIHEIVIGRARAYVIQYGVHENQLDFGQCEEKETADTVTTMMTMGIL
jgi:YgiT-type zinc finger domain-containing protein